MAVSIEEALYPVWARMEDFQRGLLVSVLLHGKELRESLLYETRLRRLGKEYTIHEVSEMLDSAFCEGIGVLDALLDRSDNYGKQLDICISKAITGSMMKKEKLESEPIFIYDYDKMEGVLEREKWMTNILLCELWDELDDETKRKIIIALKDDLVESGISQDSIASIMASGHLSMIVVRKALGFQFHIFLAKFANTVARVLFDRGLSFATNAMLQEMAAEVLGGPIGWLIFGINIITGVISWVNPREWDKFTPFVFLVGLYRDTLLREQLLHERVGDDENKRRIAERLYEVVSELNLSMFFVPEQWDKLMEVVELALTNLFSGEIPTFYLVGRSGHGKSSVINALAGKRVADVGDIKPTTAGPEGYLIEPEETSASWKIIDSRGLFESTTPDGALPGDTVDLVKKDLRNYKPHVIMHVINSTEIRNFSHDLEVFDELMSVIEEEQGGKPVVVMVPTKVDALGNPRKWPPEKYPEKTEVIQKMLTYIAKDVLNVQYKLIDKKNPHLGILVEDSNYFAIVPVCSLEENPWNIDTLNAVLVDIATSSLMNFLMNRKKRHISLRIANSVIQMFVDLSNRIDSKIKPLYVSPLVYHIVGVPIWPVLLKTIQKYYDKKANLALIPLRMLMIMIIGYIAGRSDFEDAAREFLESVGMDLKKASGDAGLATAEIGKKAVNYFFGIT